jgi:hypothetical protein
LGIGAGNNEIAEDIQPPGNRDCHFGIDPVNARIIEINPLEYPTLTA